MLNFGGVIPSNPMCFFGIFRPQDVVFRPGEESTSMWGVSKCGTGIEMRGGGRFVAKCHHGLLVEI